MQPGKRFVPIVQTLCGISCNATALQLQNAFFSHDASDPAVGQASGRSILKPCFPMFSTVTGRSIAQVSCTRCTSGRASVFTPEGFEGGKARGHMPKPILRSTARCPAGGRAVRFLQQYSERRDGLGSDRDGQLFDILVTVRKILLQLPVQESPPWPPDSSIHAGKVTSLRAAFGKKRVGIRAHFS